MLARMLGKRGTRVRAIKFSQWATQNICFKYITYVSAIKLIFSLCVCRLVFPLFLYYVFWSSERRFANVVRSFVRYMYISLYNNTIIRISYCNKWCIKKERKSACAIIPCAKVLLIVRYIHASSTIVCFFCPAVFRYTLYWLLTTATPWLEWGAF